MKQNVYALINAACRAYYSGDNEEALRLMKLAKQAHIYNGGDALNWPGNTDDRSIHEEYLYYSI